MLHSLLVLSLFLSHCLFMLGPFLAFAAGTTDFPVTLRIWSDLISWIVHIEEGNHPDICYSPTLSGHWNKPVFTFISDVPVCPWPGANCFFTHFYDYVTPNWENDGNDCQKKNICCPYLDATRASCNCNSRNFIIFNMLEIIWFFFLK